MAVDLLPTRLVNITQAGSKAVKEEAYKTYEDLFARVATGKIDQQ